MMRITYDPQADALYVQFQEGPVAHTAEVNEGVNVDLDAQENIVGMEVLFVSEQMPLPTVFSAI